MRNYRGGVGWGCVLLVAAIRSPREPPTRSRRSHKAAPAHWQATSESTASGTVTLGIVRVATQWQDGHGLRVILSEPPSR